MNATSVFRKLGAFDAIPNAMARANGAMELWRHALARTPAPVAPSVFDVVAVEGAAQLVRYRAQGVPLTKAPILLCPSLINRLYVLDLMKGNSVVERLLAAGHPVYGIDWGNPGAAERGMGLEAFVLGRLRRFLDAANADARVPAMHVLGHCIGGTMATILAAVDDRGMASLINLTAPVRFHDEGLLSAWTRAPFFDPQLVVDAVGHVPAWLTQPSFMILRPMGQPVKAMRLFQNMGDAKFLEFFRCLETWINDNVAIPDQFFVDLVGKLYRHDALFAGGLQVGGFDVSLDDVALPVLTIAAAADHIVPVDSAVTGHDRYASTVKEQHVLDGGHIGVVVGGLSKKALLPLLLRWTEETVERATQKRGDA
jgi:polyhydroxyalkanoate synthase subunit PhaC